jgi:hypothetical protein
LQRRDSGDGKGQGALGTHHHDPGAQRHDLDPDRLGVGEGVQDHARRGALLVREERGEPVLGRDLLGVQARGQGRRALEGMTRVGSEGLGERLELESGPAHRDPGKGWARLSGNAARKAAARSSKLP